MDSPSERRSRSPSPPPSPPASPEPASATDEHDEVEAGAQQQQVPSTSAAGTTRAVPAPAAVLDIYEDSAVGGGYNNPNTSTSEVPPPYLPTIPVTNVRDNVEVEQSEKAPLLAQHRSRAPPSRRKQLAFNLFMAGALLATIALIITLVVLSSGSSNSEDENGNNVTQAQRQGFFLRATGPNNTDTETETGTQSTDIDYEIIQNNGVEGANVSVQQSSPAPAPAQTQTPTPTTTTTEPPADTSIQVEVDQGILQGKRLATPAGREYLAFLGISYAASPVGNLRFQAPTEADVWEGTRDARSYKPPCVHKNAAAGGFVGQEDCLYLNVFTPANASELNSTTGAGGFGGFGGRGGNRRRQRYPVIIFVGEPGYATGNGNTATALADFFTAANVTLVTFEYRAGIFGSLNLNMSGASGNQGFKDQLLAFQWVRDNIASFQGNRRKITLLGGRGLGSSAVSAQLLSQLSGGRLFHRAVLASGTVLQPGFFQSTATLLEQALRLGQAMNCSSNSTNAPNSTSQQQPSTSQPLSSEDLLVCFGNKTTDELISATAQGQKLPSLILSVDSASAPDGDVFMTDSPAKLLEAGGNNLRLIPLMVGSTNGVLRASKQQQGGGSQKRRVRVNETEFDLASLLQLPSSNNDTAAPQSVLQQVEQFYFGFGGNSTETQTQSNTTAAAPSPSATAPDFKSEVFSSNLTDLYLDRYFNHPAAVIAQKQFERNNGTAKAGGGGGAGGFNFANLFARFQNNGVYLYFLNETVPSPPHSNVTATGATAAAAGNQSDALGVAGGFSQVLLNLWTTFADTGVPSGLPDNVTWAAVNGSAKPLQALHLNFVLGSSNETKLHAEMGPFFSERMSFWDSFNLTQIYA